MQTNYCASVFSARWILFVLSVVSLLAESTLFIIGVVKKSLHYQLVMALHHHLFTIDFNPGNGLEFFFSMKHCFKSLLYSKFTLLLVSVRKLME